jgi:hypothetical protein
VYLNAMSFVGQSRPLTRHGLATAAESLSVGVEELWTVVGVETSGCGFLSTRQPTILYERHIFHRLTNGRFDDGDISDATAGGYGATGIHQYERLARAMQLDSASALQSTSWGVGQILGTNCGEAGFADVNAMVKAMIDGEDAQLSAVCQFIAHNKLDHPLKLHDWSAFARGYNGAAFAANQYDARLRGEFGKVSAGVLPNIDVRAAQLYLTFRGFHPGPVDGFVGALTRSAITAFQLQNGVTPTGEVDDELLMRVAL